MSLASLSRRQLLRAMQLVGKASGHWMPMSNRAISYKAATLMKYPATLGIIKRYCSTKPDEGSRKEEKASNGEEEQKAEEKTQEEKENEEESERVLHAGANFKDVMYILAILGIAGIVGGAGYYLSTELFPGKMNPHSVFNLATELCKQNAPLVHILGEPIKAYGSDAGGQREGRRHFVESFAYAAEDGSQRTRIVFNLQGSHSKAVVWAEVSDKLPPNQFVYLVAQERSRGSMIVIQDNRSLVAAGMGGNKEGRAAMEQLLRGGK